ncbi:hypothetical protein CF327_g4322 [Tilletia walkeri]|uniref:Uncharacterized protein n=1 Tax=Tilletia walkeri TaxID=117179 RepID=A0A8X7NBY7_9BASI|nr:hypothetical protein CF327_g4322 [Tilletia walkeri]KAE8269694.1 hypothetical protein A4X09_0g2640 [Tilletia walkeri]
MQIKSLVAALAFASTLGTSVWAQSQSDCSNTTTISRSFSLRAHRAAYKRVAGADEQSDGEDHVPLRIPSGSRLRNITVGAKGEQLVTYWSNASRALDSVVDQAVVMFHGRDRDGDTYWTIANKAAKLANANGIAGASNNTLIVAPQFFSKTQNSGQYATNQIAFSDNAWIYGGKASFPSKTNVTAFSAITSLVTMLSNKKQFPKLKRVILVGHGGGGQFISRYSVLSPDIPSSAQVSIRYVIGDPSSNLYFTGDRPLRTSFNAVNYTKTTCPIYDTYRYGFTNITESVPTATLSPRGYFTRFAKRDVVFVVGNNDTLPNGDQSGMAILTGGEIRRDRNYMYWRYINLLAGVPNTNKNLDRAGYPGSFSSSMPTWGGSTGGVLKAQLTIIDGAKHDADLAYQSDLGVAAIFTPGLIKRGGPVLPATR